MTESTALVLPEQTTLAQLFKNENGLEPIVSKLEQAARAEAAGLTAGTAKGRDALKSLAYKVAQSKTEIDRQGKALTEQQRKEIDAVNAVRKLATTRLDALRDEIRAPVTAWEEAEKARKERIEAALADLRCERTNEFSTSDEIRADADRIKALTFDGFDEYETQAEMLRESALNCLRVRYSAAKAREDQAAELEALRAEKAAREAAEAERLAQEAAEREAREAAELAEANRIEAERQRAEESARIEREKAEAAEQARIAAEQRAKEEAERMQHEARERQEAERRAAAEREAELQRQIEAQRLETEAAAQRERDRIAEEQRAAEQARAKREADQAHRERIAGDIAAALKTMAGRATPENIAAALMDGKIPHCKVEM